MIENAGSCCICDDTDKFELLRTAKSLGTSYNRCAEILQLNRSTLALCYQKHKKPYTPTDKRRAEVMGLLKTIPTKQNKFPGRPKKKVTTPVSKLKFVNPIPTTREGLEEHFQQLTNACTQVLMKTENNIPLHLKAITSYQTTLDVLSKYIDARPEVITVTANDANRLQMALSSIQTSLLEFPEAALKVSQDLQNIQTIEVKALPHGS
jgi:hypothetical protein